MSQDHSQAGARGGQGAPGVQRSCGRRPRGHPAVQMCHMTRHAWTQLLGQVTHTSGSRTARRARWPAAAAARPCGRAPARRRPGRARPARLLHPFPCPLRPRQPSRRRPWSRARRRRRRGCGACPGGRRPRPWPCRPCPAAAARAGRLRPEGGAAMRCASASLAAGRGRSPACRSLLAGGGQSAQSPISAARHGTCALETRDLPFTGNPKNND